MKRPDLRAVRTSEPLRVPTLDEIRNWPATVSIRQAGSAIRMAESTAYKHIREGTFPFEVLTIGSQRMVLTSSILGLLDPPTVREVGHDEAS
jgi:hypothetical protein